MKQCKQHPTRELNLICFSKQCPLRFGCIQCIVSQHSDHVEQCLFVEDILDGRIANNNAELSNILSAIQSELGQSSQVTQDIEYIVEMVMMKLSYLEATLYEHYNENITQDVIELQQEHQQQYQEYTNITQIADLYTKYEIGNIDKESFNANLNTLLKDATKQTQQAKLLSSQQSLCSTSLRVSGGQLKILQNRIKRVLQEIPNQLSAEFEMRFIKAQGKDAKINMNEISMTPNGQSTLIVSENQMIYPNKYNLTLQILEYDAPQHAQILFGFVQYKKQLTLQLASNHHGSAFFSLINNTKMQYSTSSNNNMLLGDIIKEKQTQNKPIMINICFDLFEKSLIVQLDDYKLEYSRKQVQQLFGEGQTQIIDNFYKPSASYVFFLNSNKATLRCKID